MAQDYDVQRRREAAAQAAALEREEAGRERMLDDEILYADQHTGQAGVLPPNTDALETPECKDAQALLPNLTRDEWRRVHLVAPGMRLGTGDKYLDLRDLGRGELVATGEETANSSSLLVAKHDVDYIVWNKLLGRSGERVPE